MEKPKKKEILTREQIAEAVFEGECCIAHKIRIHNQACDDWEAYYEPIVRTLKEELEFLKMQVKKSDKDIETKVVERLTKSYILRELKAELQTLKATGLSEAEIKKILNKEVLERCVEKIAHENRKVIVYDEFTLNVFLYKAAQAIITARDKKRK